MKLNSVLLIDDDEAINFLHRWIIESSGMAERVDVAEGGQKALEYLTTSCGDGINETFPCPDLIFLDINMPAMNGWEFIEKYRALEKKHHGRIVLVMLTTSMFPEDEVKAKETPEISGYESKPLTPEALEKIVAKYFPEKSEV